MRFIEEFIAGSIIHIGRVIAWVLILGTVLPMMGAGLTLLVRCIYWLRFGYWITSICDGHLRYLEFTNHSNDRAFLCLDVQSGWTGVDHLINWLFVGGDASLVLFILAFTSFGIFIGSILILNRVPPDNWIRKYYESGS